MTYSIKHIIFIAAAIASLFLTWPHGVDWINAGGNIANPFQFFIDAYQANSAAAFLTVDLAFAWTIFMVWVLFDTRRIGMGMKWGWAFVGLSYLGICFAFPVYIVTRERWLDRRGTEL